MLTKSINFIKYEYKLLKDTSKNAKKKINAIQDHCGLVIDVYSLWPIKQTLGFIGLRVFRFLCVSGRNWQWLSLKNKNVATMLLPYSVYTGLKIVQWE